MLTDNKLYIAIILTCLALLLLAGCATVNKMGLGMGGTSDSFEHTVNWPEENLYNITVWRTGNLESYNEIRQLNPNLAPYGLSVGDKILIPKKLVTNEEPMPAFSSKTKRSVKKSLPTQKLGRKYHIHRVSIAGESLSIIAKWYTGDLNKWEQLADVNPNLNPNRIDIGDEILIPEDMMVRKDPITRAFVESFLPTQKKEDAPKPEPTPVPPAPEPETIQLEEDNGLELVPPKF